VFRARRPLPVGNTDNPVMGWSPLAPPRPAQRGEVAERSEAGEGRISARAHRLPVLCMALAKPNLPWPHTYVPLWQEPDRHMPLLPSEMLAPPSPPPPALTVLLAPKLFVRNDFGQLINQVRELRRDDIPDDLKIHAEVFMSQDISQTCDASPLHGRVARSHVGRDPFGSSPNTKRLNMTAS
jgi:hypothetical protein